MDWRDRVGLGDRGKWCVSESLIDAVVEVGSKISEAAVEAKCAIIDVTSSVWECFGPSLLAASV